jgi:hypothetical protein
MIGNFYYYIYGMIVGLVVGFLIGFSKKDKNA